MANPCFIKYKGKEYTYEEFVELLHSGELDALIKSGELDVSKLKGGKQDAVQEKINKNAIQKEKSLSLQEKENGKSNSNKNEFQERTQRESRNEQKKKRNVSDEDTKGRMETSNDWIKSISGNDRQKERNDTEKLLRESNIEEEQIRDILDDYDRKREEIRTQGGNGKNIGKGIIKIGTRTSSEREQSRQYARKFKVTNPIATRKGTRGENDKGTTDQGDGLSETERGAVVEGVRLLYSMQDQNSKTLVKGILQKLLHENVSNKEKTNQLIDLLTEQIIENHAFSFKKSGAGVLRQERPEVVVPKVEQGDGGNKKPPGKGEAKGQEEPPKSVNPVVDANMKAAHGLKSESIKDKFKRYIKEVSETVHHFKYVREKEFPSVYNKLRLFEAIPDRVKKEAFEKIAEVMTPIADNKVLYQAFERNVVMQDLLYDIDRGLFDGKELPWGYKNVEEIRQDAKNIQDYVDKNPKLKKVFEDRNKMMNQIKEELINHNLLKADARENKNYFHHEVLAYMDQFQGVGVSSRDVRLHQKGWQRSRTGSMQAYNTNYLESEFKVLAQSLEQLEIKSVLNKIGAEVDIRPQLEKLAEEKGGNWKDYIPEGYTSWHPKSGTNAYKAASVTEKAIDNIVNQMDGDKVLLNELLSESEKATWIIPEKVAAQLNEMKIPTKEMILTRVSRGINSSWKQWVLMNPYRVLKYNLNNMSGDLDIALAYDPRILSKKYAHTAMKELWTDLKGKGMSQDIKESLEHGVITSGLSIQEIPNINQEGVFRSLTGKDNLIMKYWRSTKDYTQFRENLLRVATYKYFKDQLNKGKIVYGASNKEAIDALTDVNEKAGKLARELIGDYGNLSQGGQWLRSHIYPFWSWVEINAPRYYRLLKNSPFEGRSEGAIVGKTAGVGIKNITVNVGKLYAKVMLLGGMVTLWNRIFFRDEDEELRKLNNRQLRLIVGRRDDGSIMTVRVSGAFSDVLSWVGAEDIVRDIKDVQNEKSTIEKKIKEAGSAFSNKLIQGLMPIEKTAVEMIIGKSLYPNIFKPSTIRDSKEHALRMLSMDKIYRYLTKKPLRGAKELTGLIIYDTDPGEAAYYAMRQRIYDFLDDKEIDSPSGEPTKRSNALYYYKQSLKLKNDKLAKYWHDKYMQLGGSEKGEKLSVQKGEVLSALPKKVREEWLKSLDEEDKEVLKMANDWYAKTYRIGIKENVSRPGAY